MGLGNKFLETLVVLASTIKRRFFKLEYDAAAHMSEQYYANIYLNYFKKYLPGPPASVLDAGCGTGRFLLPLAEKGYKMTGIDFTKDSIRRINQKVGDLKTKPEIIYGDMLAEIKRIPDHSFDAIIAIEALYCSKNRNEITEQISRCLKPGGYLLITHKPRFYYMLQSLRNNNIGDCKIIASESEGHLLKGQHRVYYNWQTLRDINVLYDGLDLVVEEIAPIGPYSGFSVDPLSEICDPGELSKRDQDVLYSVEKNYDEDTLMASRYVIVAARKPFAE